MYPGYGFLGFRRFKISEKDILIFLERFEKSDISFNVLKYLNKKCKWQYYKVQPYEISAIRKYEKYGWDDTRERLEVGSAGEIKRGLFEGMKGVIVRIGSKDDVYVSLKFMGTDTLVKVNRKDICELGVRTSYEQKRLLDAMFDNFESETVGVVKRM